ncbi:hypothetical protein HMPREF1618_03108 [Escherichia coli 908691]|nr:hypothetical protein HMPREF1618_03108 [Escherichia coli 908691]
MGSPEGQSPFGQGRSPPQATEGLKSLGNSGIQDKFIAWGVDRGARKRRGRFLRLGMGGAVGYPGNAPTAFPRALMPVLWDVALAYSFSESPLQLFRLRCRFLAGCEAPCPAKAVELDGAASAAPR